jgi:hypothetical protein
MDNPWRLIDNTNLFIRAMYKAAQITHWYGRRVRYTPEQISRVYPDSQVVWTHERLMEKTEIQGDVEAVLWMN